MQFILYSKMGIFSVYTLENLSSLPFINIVTMYLLVWKNHYDNNLAVSKTDSHRVKAMYTIGDRYTGIILKKA